MPTALGNAKGEDDSPLASTIDVTPELAGASDRRLCDAD